MKPGSIVQFTGPDDGLVQINRFLSSIGEKIPVTREGNYIVDAIREKAMNNGDTGISFEEYYYPDMDGVWFNIANWRELQPPQSITVEELLEAPELLEL
jgi:hypothetical protein